MNIINTFLRVEHGKNLKFGNWIGEKSEAPFWYKSCILKGKVQTTISLKTVLKKLSEYYQLFEKIITVAGYSNNYLV